MYKKAIFFVLFFPIMGGASSLFSAPLWQHGEITLTVFFAAAILLGALVVIIARLKKQKQKLESLVHEKTLEAKEIREKAEWGIRTRSDFLANMSHEIRTPLNGIIGMTDLTLESDLTPDQRVNLELVKYAANELLIVINDILDFSKIEAGHLKLEFFNFDLSERMKEIIRLLSIHAHKKKLHLKSFIHPDIPPVLNGDPVRLNQILMNLLGNAIKFTEKGEVLLTVELDPDREKPGGGKDEKSPVFLRFSVSDTGIGISPEKKTIIFDPFSQGDLSTTRKYGGTGLGLSISLRLVQLMKGELQVESPANLEYSSFPAEQKNNNLLTDKAVSSEGGPGCLFYFSLPFTVPPESLLKTRAAAEGVEELMGLAVLLIAADPQCQKKVKELCYQWRMSLDTVTREADAWEILQEAHKKENPLNLILMAHHFAGFDGAAFAKKIKNHPAYENIEIVMLLEPGQTQDEKANTGTGISTYIPYPLDPIKLLEIFQRLLVKSGSCLMGKGPNSRHMVYEQHQQLRCLVAEDNKLNQNLINRMLTKLGHHVTLVENGLEVLAALEKQEFNLVFMDIRMPEMGGIEATKQIRKWEAQGRLVSSSGKPSHIPIIALTAHAMKGDRERFLNAGMDAYVSKPVKIESLISAIDCVSPLIEDCPPARET